MHALKKFLLLTTALTMVFPRGTSAKVLDNVTETLTPDNSIYQKMGENLTILNGANYTFEGGEIWDYSAYLKSGDDGETETVNFNTASGHKTYVMGTDRLSGDLEINNGHFSGAIKIYKGLDVDSITVNKDGVEKKIGVSTEGAFKIIDGTFDYTQNSELLMKKSTTGDFELKGGNHTLTNNSTVRIGSVGSGNGLLITGGTFNIKSGTLEFTGNTIDYNNASNVSTLTGDGTLSFDGVSTISSIINWDTGTLRLASQTMDMNANVAVKKFEFDAASVRLTINKDVALTVSENFDMSKSSASLVGDGALNLMNGANATFMKLDFGTIRAYGKGEPEKGVLTFKGETELKALEINQGTLNINSLVTVKNLTLKGNSVANINAALVVENLDFDDGRINFSDNDKTITLKNGGTIKDTAKFTYNAGITDGRLIVDKEAVLEFTDNGGQDKFSNDVLSVQAEPDAIVNFNSLKGVKLNKLDLRQATANFNAGYSEFKEILFGNSNELKYASINIEKEASVSADKFVSNFAAKIKVDGTLTIKNGEIRGEKSAATTFAGTGTLQLAGDLTFDGRFDNFGTLQIDGTNQNVKVTYGGLFDDAVLNKLRFSGTNESKITLEKGILKVKNLQFDDSSNGVIDIVAGGTLALDAGGNDVSSIIHGTGSIGGAGTLLLVGNTSVNFGGNDKIKNLGTLKIEDGTATISGSIKIGAVEFVPNKKGTLNIESGKVLELQKIQTKDNNTVKGAGTLKLTGTEKSTFGGPVSALGTLEFANGGVEFSNGGVSSVGTITGNGGDLTVNNGTLEIGDALSMTGGKVSGSGTLRLTKGGSISTKNLNRLIVGGNTTFKEDSSVTDLQFSKAAEIDITSALTVGGAVTTVDGAIIKGGTLSVLGTGTFVKDSVQTNVLSLSNGAKATFTGNNEVNRLDLAANSAVSINSGATLTLAQDAVGSAQSVFTGAGTLALNKSGMTVNSKLSDLGGLSVLQSATLSGTAQVGSITVGNGALTVNAAAQANTVSIASGAELIQNADMTVGTLSFGANSGSTLTVKKTLNITQKIDTASNTLNGAGTINLSGGANGSFATGTSFEKGKLRIGSGTASFTGNTTMASVDFSGDDGRLNIESGNTLTLAKIATKASNTVTGEGILRLNGTGSTFDAPIVSLGEINIAGGRASFNKNATVRKLSFDDGSATVGSGAVLSISDLAQNKSGTLGTVSGGGVLKIKEGKLSTGGNRIGAVYVGSGKVSIADTSATGALVFEDENGTLNIEAGKTLTVSDTLNVMGNLTGDGTLILTNGGTFSKALTFGAIETGAGALTFYEDTTARKVAVGNGSAYFRKGTNISDLSIDAGSVFFNDANTKIGALSMTGAGKVTFNQNASISNGATIGGTLDIGVTHLSVSNGLTFNDNSSLHLRLTAAATDDAGKIIDHTAYGKIDVTGGKIAIGNNVNLDLTIDYGLHTATDGTEFQLVSGAVGSGSFTFANSRYKLEEVTCSSGSGFCYRLKETSNAEEIVTEEKGSQNNQNTAAAVLDGGLFNESDKMFPIASHLDALSQKKGGGRAYLNALTALAPDVSGAVTGQSVLTQTRVSKSVFNRLSGLQQKMGNRSEKYRQMRELYGRSGGSAYSSGLMRSADYYKRAGYDAEPAGRAYPTYDIRRTPRNYIPYDDEDIRPKRKVAKYRSQRQADYGAFYGARPAVGVWAQGLYNTNEYKSASKEDGFSADSTGVSMGLDVIFADVAAIGFGYARTTSDLTALQRSTDVSGDTFFLYGMYKPADWYLSGVVSSGKNTFEEQKNLSGLMVSDNYDTKTVGGQLMLGFDRKGWNPAFGLRYSSVSRAAHEDSVGQKIASFSNTVFSAVAETQKTFELSRAGKGVWSSDLSAGLVYDFSRSEDEATVSLTNGASYTVKGSDMDPYGAELGAAISYVWGKSVDLSARYNLDIRPEWFSHTLTATLRVTF
ncbi:MAG: autotransporter domain-containing protein [Acetobacter sp.]|nr:autotransporter domain-containing protein [Acetobacter sp.]